MIDAERVTTLEKSRGQPEIAHAKVYIKQQLSYTTDNLGHGHLYRYFQTAHPRSNILSVPGGQWKTWSYPPV